MAGGYATGRLRAQVVVGPAGNLTGVDNGKDFW